MGCAGVSKGRPGGVCSLGHNVYTAMVLLPFVEFFDACAYIGARLSSCLVHALRHPRTHGCTPQCVSTPMCTRYTCTVRLQPCADPFDVHLVVFFLSIRVYEAWSVMQRHSQQLERKKK